MNDTFWNMLLVDLKIPFHLQALWLQHKDHFLRTEVLHHFQCYGIDEDFSKLILMFNKTITQAELLNLFMIQQKPNFEVLVSIIDKEKKYDYQVF